jgi:hypothetical protein
LKNLNKLPRTQHREKKRESLKEKLRDMKYLKRKFSVHLKGVQGGNKEDTGETTLKAIMLNISAILKIGCESSERNDMPNPQQD